MANQDPGHEATVPVPVMTGDEAAARQRAAIEAEDETAGFQAWLDSIGPDEPIEIIPWQEQRNPPGAA